MIPLERDSSSRGQLPSQTLQYPFGLAAQILRQTKGQSLPDVGLPCLTLTKLLIGCLSQIQRRRMIRCHTDCACTATFTLRRPGGENKCRMWASWLCRVVGRHEDLQLQFTGPGLF